MINTEKLLSIQKELHYQLVKEHNLENENLFDNTVLALMVEVAEMANEWRGFKHWSHDREPRTFKWVKCQKCNGTKVSKDGSYTCVSCAGTGETRRNPLLEEFVDGLSFIYELWIIKGYGAYGRELKYYFYPRDRTLTMTQRLKALNRKINLFDLNPDISTLSVVYSDYLYIGSLFGFTPDQIEQAFIEKKKVNYQRIEEGY